MSSKWQMFLNGALPYVVLDNVLYQIGVGRVSFCFLDDNGTTHTNTPTMRVDKVPMKHKSQLTKRGWKLQNIGFFPMRRYND